MIGRLRTGRESQAAFQGFRLGAIACQKYGMATTGQYVLSGARAPLPERAIPPGRRFNYDGL